MAETMGKTDGSGRGKRKTNILLAVAIALIALSFYFSAFFLSFE